MRDPSTRAEWQEAADAANGALHLNSAREYGLVAGGPEVDVARCQFILDSAKRLGIVPSIDSVEGFVRGILDRERPRAAPADAHRPSRHG